MEHPSKAERPDWTQSLLVLPELIALDTRIWWAPHRNRGNICTSAFEVISQEVLHMHVAAERPLVTVHDWARMHQYGIDKLAEVRHDLDPF